ncbi:MAG: hypothetical protein L3J03_05010 [Desulfobacterales bacterium]|nr:hypothetical protein [Desulfobacterales bacterium]
MPMPRFIHLPLLLWTGIMLILCIAPVAVAASDSVPRQDITVAFDLDQNRLSAVSRITIPAGRDLALHLDGLKVTGIRINGVLVQADPEKAQLRIPAADQDQEIEINYTREAAPAPGSVP